MTARSVWQSLATCEGGTCMTNRDIDPLHSLETIRRTLANVRRHSFYSSGPVYTMWAVVWFIGFSMTFVAEAVPLNIIVPEAFLGVAWATLMTVGGLYTFVFYRKHPVDVEYRRRFALTWMLAFTLMAITVWSRTTVGVTFNAVDFPIMAVHTLSVIYLVTGTVLMDRLQIAVGVWLGVSNLAALRLAFPNYLLAMGLLLGFGFTVAGLIEDRRRRQQAVEVDD